MRSGRHFAEFTLLSGYMMVGAIRPGHNVSTNTGGIHTADGHCTYESASGAVYPGGKHWEGSQLTERQGDCVGMLLDLGQGSMTLYKNGEKLGVMVTEGLSGPLCWAVDQAYEGDSVRIGSAPAPASPTEEELASARAWQEANDPDSDE